jgi:hypothetical protein
MAATIPPEGSSGFDCSGPALFYKHIECAGDCSDPVTPDYPPKIFLTLTGLRDGGCTDSIPGSSPGSITTNPSDCTYTLTGNDPELGDATLKAQVDGFSIKTRTRLKILTQ